MNRERLENFLQKKLAKEKILEEIKEIEVEGIGVLKFKKLNDLEFLRVQDLVPPQYEEPSNAWTYSFFSELIYACCDELKSKDLRDSLGVKLPSEVVEKVFLYSEIQKIGLELHVWQMTSNLTEQIKN